MDVSLLVSLLLGLPAAVLATLRIIDWWKKKANGLRGVKAKHKIASPEPPAEQGLATIMSQAEVIAEAEMEIAEELRHYAATHRR